MTTVYDTHRSYWLKKNFISESFNALLLANIQPGSEILDLGCGGGRLALALAEVGKVTGLDFSAEMIQDLQLQQPTVTWQIGNAESPDTWTHFPRFDAIVSNVCIRKDQCRLDRVMQNITDTQNRSCLIFRIQGSKDLSGYVVSNPCYSEAEIENCLSRFGWTVKLSTERYHQRFTSFDYLRSSIEKIGMKPAGQAFLGTKRNLSIGREYHLVCARLAN